MCQKLHQTYCSQAYSIVDVVAAVCYAQQGKCMQGKLDQDAALSNVPEAAPKLLQLARSTPLLSAAIVGHKGAAHVCLCSSSFMRSSAVTACCDKSLQAAQHC